MNSNSEKRARENKRGVNLKIIPTNIIFIFAILIFIYLGEYLCSLNARW